MGGSASPAGRLVRRFDRVANVLPIPLPYFAQVFAQPIQHRGAVTRIGTDLFPADVEFRGAIYRGQRGGGAAGQSVGGDRPVSSGGFPSSGLAAWSCALRSAPL